MSNINKDINAVIAEIDGLLRNYSGDTERFSIEYDEDTGGLYGKYTPWVNDPGFAVTDDLIIVDDASKSDLQKLRDYLKDKWLITSFNDWCIEWGYRDED